MSHAHLGSVKKSLLVLEELKARGEAGVTELADELPMTKGAVHHHLSTLKDSEYVTQTRDGKYRVSLLFLDYAHHLRQRFPIGDVVKQEVDELASESGELALFSVEEHGRCVCLYKSKGANAVDTPVYEGYRTSLHSTAVGKAILAHAAPEKREEILQTRDLERFTDRTITDRAALEAELEEIRETGVAFNNGEKIEGLMGIGVPIKPRVDEIDCGIAVIGPQRRMSEDAVCDELENILLRRANVIEINSTSV